MNKVNIFLSLIFVQALSACEKVIDVELPDNSPLLSVESQISSEKDTWKVKLSRSQDYFEKDGQFFVGDATVQIIEEGGVTRTLNYIGNGIYESEDSAFCEVNKRYTLQINWNGKTYTASEACRPQLPIDTFAAFFLPSNNGFIPSGWYAFIGAQEWPEKGDHYRWEVFKNGTLQEGFGSAYILDSDELVEFSFFNAGIDPKDPLANNRLPRPIGGPYEVGDRVMVKQYAISKTYFDFLNDIATQRDRAGSPFDAPPANPKGNIEGALGYFSVVNAQSRTLVVQE